MNYEDELERARAKRSRKRQSNTGARSSAGTRNTSVGGSAGVHGSTGTHSRMHHVGEDGPDILTNHSHAATRASHSAHNGTYRRRKKKNKSNRLMVKRVN